MKKWLSLLFWLSSVNLSAAQEYINSRLMLGREFAGKCLQAALADSAQQKAIAKRWRLPMASLPDTTAALGAIEPLLFRVYRKKVIEQQKPYEIYRIEDYWVISGTLPYGHVGGVFIAVVDVRNSRVLELIHGQ
ncbi:NTF2 fold immunity protein [Hymenobacter sp. BT190]|uniref:NTF2 fold immunity protein n=1 Tax=Hymenobacter sp. BT190 TaxID=2763505 RepID=UPI00165194BD|nr:NTF2 fold immunity protein [Hymenobacter sp. BT190]MBC6698508.1 hypothetical protein [Hymenobacter sp. BT190]